MKTQKNALREKRYGTICAKVVRINRKDSKDIGEDKVSFIKEVIIKESSNKTKKVLENLKFKHWENYEKAKEFTDNDLTYKDRKIKKFNKGGIW